MIEFGWIYFLMGFACVVTEVFVSGRVFIWPGLSLIVASIPAMWEASPSVVLLTFLVSLVFFTLIVRRFVRSISQGRRNARIRNHVEIVGKLGYVKKTIRGKRYEGMVAIDRQMWSARTVCGRELQEGDVVEVASVDRGLLVVIPF